MTILSRQIFLVSSLAVSIAIFAGCSSSEESVKPGTVIMRIGEVDSLHNAIADCNSRMVTLEHENQSVHSLAVDLETQVATLKAQLAAIPPPPPKPVLENQLAAYESCLAMFRQHKYEESANTLQHLLDDGVPLELEDNCEYWLGECAFGMKDFSNALGHFQKVFTYARSEKKDDAQIMIANSYYFMGEKLKAKTEYQKFLDKFPASPYVKLAQDRLARL